MTSFVSRRVGLESVAAAVLAATLLLPGCGDAGRGPRSDAGAAGPAAAGRPPEPGSAVAADTVPVPLDLRWLVAPDPDQRPPIAAPAALAVDEAEGRVYLLELRPPEVRVYSAADGEFLGRIGREGGGPGEFRAPMSLAVGSSGDLAVVAVDGRVSFWRSDGGFIGGAKVGSGLGTEIVPARGDSFLVKIDRLPPADVAEFHLIAEDGGSGGVRFDDGEISGLHEAGARSRNHTYAVAGTPEGDLLIAPPGPEYRILRISPTGGVAQTVLRPEIGPLQRSAEQIAAVRKRVREAFQAAGRPVPDGLPVPLFRTHIGALAVDPSGGIWALTRREGDSTPIIDRFEASGRFVASYHVTHPVVDIAVTSESIYLLVLGDMNVPGISVAAAPRLSGR